MLLLSCSAPLLLLAAVQAVLTGATECESYGYKYTLQPPEDIVCSPYNRGVLNLTCAVAGDMVEDIQWYFRPAEGSQAIILTNGSQVTITHSEFDGDYSVIMIIEGLSEENEGFYWCQGLVSHHDQSLELSQSAEFELRPRDQYFPSNCPNKALKSSEVRCAAVIPLPITSSSASAVPEHMSTFDVLLPYDESSTVELEPTRSVPGHSQTIPTGLATATTKPSPTSRPTVTDNTIGGTTSDGLLTGSQTNTTTTSTTQPPLTQGTIQLSDIILYAILGLLGCLVLLVFSLSIVISILCCKKRRRGPEGKDAPYDQFSTESEAPPGTLTLKSLDSFPLAPPLPPPYRLPLHPSSSSTITPSSSGVYDEIHTIAPHHGGQFPLYQEISPVLQVNRGMRIGSLDATDRPSGAEQSLEDSAVSAADPVVQSRFEHPYDLPDQLGSTSHSPPMPSHQHASTHSSNRHQEQQHGYDSLQQQQPSALPAEPQTDARSSMGDSSEFTNSNLQVTPPPPEEITSTLTGSGCAVALEMEAIAPPPPPVELAVVDTQPEEEGEGSSSTSSSATTPLPAIPEHPYHVLEERPDRRDQGMQNGARHSEPHPPQILCHLSLSEDEGYDRLVGPPHIYHILQKSPSLVRPRFRECSPVSGYHHLDNRMDGETTTHGSESLQQQQQQHCLVRLQAPSTDSDAPHSEESSMVSGSEIFDDPQYNVSPKRNGVGGGVSAGQSKPLQRNSHYGQLTTLERKKVGKEIDFSKYRGDYERDPMYMQLVQKLSEPATSDDTDHVDVRLHVNRDKGGSNKSASLPDITHTYQSLQALTRDPLRNYEMLHRRPRNI